MEAAAGDHEPVAPPIIGVREVDGEQGVVVLDRRAQDQRPLASELELEAREEAGVLVVEAELAEPHRGDVAEAIEHRERVAVLEHPRAVVDAGRAGEDVEPVLDPDEVLEALAGHPTRDRSSRPCANRS